MKFTLKNGKNGFYGFCVVGIEVCVRDDIETNWLGEGVAYEEFVLLLSSLLASMALHCRIN